MSDDERCPTCGMSLPAFPDAPHTFCAVGVRTNRDESPERTPEMEANGQVWVWLWDVPRLIPQGVADFALMDLTRREDETGRWEVRGTGVLIESCEPECSDETGHVETCWYYGKTERR